MLLAEGAWNPVKPEIGTLIWTTLTFLVVVGVLWKTAWGKILDAIDSRSRSIRDDLAKAETSRKEGEALLAQYQKQLEASRQEAQKIIEEGRSDALRLKDTILKEARGEGEQMIARAKKEIELAEAKAVEELRRQSAELALAAARRILAESLRAEDHQAIVKRFVQDAGRAQIAAAGERN